jgi:hypothetical protein
VIPRPGVVRASFDVNGTEVGHWDFFCEGQPAQIQIPPGADAPDAPEEETPPPVDGT